jgi:hypothetical protein
MAASGQSSSIVTARPSPPLLQHTGCAERGSLRHIITSNPRTRLYVSPHIWTQHHLSLLRISISQRPCERPPHRRSCSICAARGKVFEDGVRMTESGTSSDIDQRLIWIVVFSIRSLQDGLQKRLFRVEIFPEEAS